MRKTEYQPKPFDTMVYIGRFQPFHNGHAAVLEQAMKLAKKVLVIIGSANEPRTYKNPFTVNERIDMVYDYFYARDMDVQNCECFTIESSLYNDQAWVTRVQEIVDYHSVGEAIGIIGHLKDESSFYLKMFPQWEFVSADLVEPLDATQIRDHYFSDYCNFGWFEGTLPKGTIDFLKKFHGTKEYEQIVKEKQFIHEYKRQFANLPYPPIFVTTDAVVMTAGHVLMVKRRAEPGKGLLAFPGGFVNAKTDKSILDACIRELKEETKIKVPEKVLIGNIKECKVFDAVDRSARGRIITHAFNIVLDEQMDQGLPKVKGSDDAEKAMWIPISKITRSVCFEDHYDILMHFLGR